MMEYERFAGADTYCSFIGNKVAIDRITKLHPEKLQAIQEKYARPNPFAGMISITIIRVRQQ